RRRPMRRREFITLLGGAAVAWPLAARAQQGDPMRRLGVLQPALEHDTEVLIWKTVFVQRLQELGWTDGRNLVIESRFGAIGSNRTRFCRPRWSTPIFPEFA